MIFYTVYRTQNIVNGKYYFGVHKTKDPYDGYLGSGKILKRAIAKYGEQSFIKNICFIFDNPEEAFAKEFELIETYRSDPLCYNLRQGGSGGFDWINREGLNRTPEFIQHLRMIANMNRSKAHESLRKKLADRVQRTRFIESVKQGQRRVGFDRNTFSGKVHTDETKRRIGEKNKIAQKGERNSSYGKRWMRKGTTEVKIVGSEVQALLLDGWVFGRKV
jgi:hypothetical protein